MRFENKYITAHCGISFLLRLSCFLNFEDARARHWKSAFARVATLLGVPCVWVYPTMPCIASAETVPAQSKKCSCGLNERDKMS